MYQVTVVPVSDSTSAKWAFGSTKPWANCKKKKKHKKTMADHGIDQALLSATSTTQAIFNDCKCSQPEERSLHVEPIWTTPRHPIFSILLLTAKNPDYCPGPTQLDDHSSTAHFENSQLEAFVVRLMPTCLQQPFFFFFMDFYLTVGSLWINCQKSFLLKKSLLWKKDPAEVRASFI